MEAQRGGCGLEETTACWGWVGRSGSIGAESECEGPAGHMEPRKGPHFVPLTSTFPISKKRPPASSCAAQTSFSWHCVHQKKGSGGGAWTRYGSQTPPLLPSKAPTLGLWEGCLAMGSILETAFYIHCPVWALELYFLPKQLWGYGSDRRPGPCS